MKKVFSLLLALTMTVLFAGLPGIVLTASNAELVQETEYIEVFSECGLIEMAELPAGSYKQ